MNDWPTVLLGVGAAIAVSAAAVTVAWLHTRRTSVDAARDGVSAYAVGRYGPQYRFQVVACGLSALVLAVALARLGPAPVGGLGLLVVYGLTRIAIAAFPTDLDGPLTRTGQIHALLAAAAFIAIGIAAPTIGEFVVREADARVTTVLAVGATGSARTAVLVALSAAVPLAVLATFGAGSTPRTRRVFGLVERLFYVASLSWLIVVAVLVADTAARGS